MERKFTVSRDWNGSRGLFIDETHNVRRITVIGAYTDRIEVEVTVIKHSGGIDFDGFTVAIEQRQNRTFEIVPCSTSLDFTLEYTITMPSNSVLEINAEDTCIDVKGFNGYVDIATSSNINISECCITSGYLSTNIGDISVKNTKVCSLDVKTKYGLITLEVSKGYEDKGYQTEYGISAVSTSGNINISSGGVPLKKLSTQFGMILATVK